MEVNQTMLLGEVKNAGFHKKTHLMFALDLGNNVLHLLDDGDHASTSLINLISSRLKNQILRLLGFENTNVRCFIYQEGTIGEYCFIKEDNFDHPFLDIPLEDKRFIYDPFYHRTIEES